MVRIDDAVIIKYDKGGHFEVLADPDKVLEFREGKDVDVAGALAVMEIFKDARKAEKASEAEINRVFQTDDPVKIASEIFKNGEFHPTAEQKRKMLENVRSQIIGMIVMNSVDPRTKLPHTRDRVEWALKEARVQVNFRPAREQLTGVLKIIRTVLPISFGTSKLDMIIPAQYAPSLYGKVKKTGNIIKEAWLANGSLEVKLEVPSGMKVDVISEFGNATKGELIVKEE